MKKWWRSWRYISPLNSLRGWMRSSIFLDLGSREELVRCTVLRYVDRYLIVSKRTVGHG